MGVFRGLAELNAARAQQGSFHLNIVLTDVTQLVPPINTNSNCTYCSAIVCFCRSRLARHEERADQLLGAAFGRRKTRTQNQNQQP